MGELEEVDFFGGCRAIVFGVKPWREPARGEILSALLRNCNGPVVFGLSAGHITPMDTVPLGLSARLTASKSDSAFEMTVIDDRR